jgi:hypothetical protein
MVSKLITEVAEGVARASAETPKSGFRAYHGTPHVFPDAQVVIDKDTGMEYVRRMDDPIIKNLMAKEPDRFEIVAQNELGVFDLSKIGTGEGAQAYGYGGYLAGGIETARNYRSSLLGQHGIEDTITIDGKPLSDIYTDLMNQEAKGASDAVEKMQILEDLEFGGDVLAVEEAIKTKNYSDEAVRWFESIRPTVKRPGALYEVNINADQSDLLDWDAEYANQSDKVKRVLEKYRDGIEQFLEDYTSINPDLDSLDGQYIYNTMRRALEYDYIDVPKDIVSAIEQGNSDKAVSMLLNRDGVTGINYLDGVSRRKGGDVNNYVIFDPRIIDISKRYGIALPMAGLILANQDAEAADSTGLAVDIVPPLRAPTFENDDATGKVLDARQGANLSAYDRAMMKAQEKQEPMSLYEAIPARAERFARDVTIPVARDVFGGLIEAPRQALAGFLDATAEAAKILDEAMGIEDVEYLTIEADPRTVTGAGVRSISQFLTGFSPALKGIRALKVAEKTGKAKTFVESALASGVADATVFDPQEDRLSNLIQEVPALQNPVTEYLAASPEDTDAEGRLKNAVEGLTIGFLGEGLVQGIKLIKNRRALVETAEAEGKTVEELVEEAAATMKGGVPAVDVMPPGQEYIPFSEAAEAVQPTIRVPQFKAGTTEADPEAAQNINLANLNTTDDVATLIDEVAKADSPNINDARRQKITNDELPKLADDLGMTVEDLLARRQGEAFNAEQILAARKILVASGENLVKLAQVARAGSEMDLALFRRAMAQHRAIQSQVSGMTAEAGRALQSFRIVAASSREQERLIKEALETTGGEDVSRKMAEMLSDLDRPEQIGRFVKEANTANTIDMLYEVWINGLLSGPTTHMVNILSNTMVAALTVGERKIASAIGPNIPPGETSAQLKGMIDGARDGFRLAWNALKTGEPTDPMQKIESEKHRAISGENLNIAGVPGRFADFIGEAIRVPGRLLTAGDEMFKSVGYRMELYAQAYRQAFNEGLRDEAAAKRVIEIIENPPENIRRSAIDAARYQTFTNSLKETRIRGIGELGQLAEEARRKPSIGPYARVIIPFVRTPTNIASFTVERTPLALASRSIRAELAAGGARRDLALGKLTAGAMLMGVTADLVLSGHITGAGPTNRDMRNIMRATGWQPYSIKVGDTYYAYNRLDPIGGQLGLAADVTEIIGQTDEATANELATAAVISVSQNMASKTYMSSVSEFFDAFFSSSVDPEANNVKLQRYLQRMAGSAVPSSIATIERTMSPEMSATYSSLDRIKSRIPGYSDTLPPRRNIFGEPVVLGGGIGPDIMSPVYTSTVKDDPIADEMVRQQVAVGMPRRQILGIELDAQQYDRYILLYSGIEAKVSLRDELKRTINSRSYKNGSDGPEGTKALMIKSVFTGYRDMAKAQLIAEDSRLANMINEAKERERALRMGR